MPIKCLIIDDEPLAIELIKTHIAQDARLELVASFQNPMDAFGLLQKEQIDLIFLDIQMPMLTGIEFLKSIPNPPSVIFTTAYRDYAIEAYELNVIDYLLKPITFQRFFKAINKYVNLSKVPVPSSRDLHTPPIRTYIYIKDSRRTFKVKLADILYIESIRDYIRIHLAASTLMTKEKISDFEQKLPAPFLRVHRSFIINTQHISAFTSSDIEILETVIPIGISYKQKVMQILK